MTLHKLKPVLAFAQVGEHQGRIGAGHAKTRLDIGVVGTKKRIRRKFDRDGGWER
jgi:hypothetical protein